jgi:hypothetical protein
MLDLVLRESRGDWSRHEPAFIDMIWDHLDPGTFDAILRLYRSAPPGGAGGRRQAARLDPRPGPDHLEPEGPVPRRAGSGDYAAAFPTRS